jgi:hypothetical protein
MSEYVHRKSLGKALRARGESDAKSIEVKLNSESASRLRDTLLRPDAQGQVVSILVDEKDLAASVLRQERVKFPISIGSLREPGLCTEWVLRPGRHDGAGQRHLRVMKGLSALLPAPILLS